MTLNNKRSFWKFWKSYYFFLIIMVVFSVGMVVFAALYEPDREKLGAVRLEDKNVKCIYIGHVNGTSMDAYKLTVDSVDYILIKSYQGVTITKAH